MRFTSSSMTVVNKAQMQRSKGIIDTIIIIDIINIYIKNLATKSTAAHVAFPGADLDLSVSHWHQKG